MEERRVILLIFSGTAVLQMELTFPFHFYIIELRSFGIGIAVQDGRADMGVFEEMLDMEVREKFLAYKDDSISCKPEEATALRSYLLSDRCTADILRLKAGDYYFDPPTQFARRKSRSGKKRLVYSLKKENLMLTQLMTFALRKYDSVFSKNLYSFRSGRRVADLIMRLKSVPGLKNKYILKTDVRSYGDSIDGELLLVLKSALFCVAFSAVLCLISHIITNKAAVAVFEIVFALAVILLGSLLYNSLLEPETASNGVTVSTNENGETVLEPIAPHPNPEYIPEPQRSVYKRILNALPSGQAILLANTADSEEERLDQPLYACCSSIAITAAFTVVGLLHFNRKDLK